MIIGPGVEWYRGDGPPPAIDAITLRVGRLPVTPRRTPPDRNKKRRATACRPRSTRPATQCWQSKTWRTPPACRVEPPAHHNPDPTDAPAFRPPKKANKRSTNFPKPAQTCSLRRQSVNFPKSAQTYSHHPKKQQSRWRQPAVKTPNHLPSIKSKTSPPPAATTRNLIKTRRSQPNALRRAVLSRSASHNSDPRRRARVPPAKKANKGVRIFQNPLKPVHRKRQRNSLSQVVRLP